MPTLCPLGRKYQHLTPIAGNPTQAHGEHYSGMVADILSLAARRPCVQLGTNNTFQSTVAPVALIFDAPGMISIVGTEVTTIGY